MVGTALRLTVSARAENVAIVRQALTALGEDTGLSEVQLADLKTAVTEACMNAVVHAYNGDPGPIEIATSEDDGFMVVRVRDFGAGFHPRPADGESLRLGIPLIAALSDSFAISGAHGGGTEVAIRIRLGAPGDGEPPASREDGAATPATGAHLAFRDGALPIGPILARVIGMFAARAEFSLDRLSDTILLGEAISAHTPADFIDGHFAVAIEDADRNLELRIGPLVPGGGERLLTSLDTPGLPPGKLRALASATEIVGGPDGGETVVLSFFA